MSSRAVRKLRAVRRNEERQQRNEIRRLTPVREGEPEQAVVGSPLVRYYKRGAITEAEFLAGQRLADAWHRSRLVGVRSMDPTAPRGGGGDMHGRLLGAAAAGREALGMLEQVPKTLRSVLVAVCIRGMSAGAWGARTGWEEHEAMYELKIALGALVARRS